MAEGGLESEVKACSTEMSSAPITPPCAPVPPKQRGSLQRLLSQNGTLEPPFRVNGPVTGAAAFRRRPERRAHTSLVLAHFLPFAAHVLVMSAPRRSGK